MRIDARDLVLIALALALLVALVQTARLWWIGFARAHRLRAQSARAAAGEARAEQILRAAGFTVLARQVAHSWRVLVDGEPVSIDLRADYLVERGDRRFVAEVKTGRLAPRIESAATRRQLLEYRCAFDVDGVLLVDADAEVQPLHSIEFEMHAPREAAPRARPFALLALAFGVILVALVLAARHCHPFE